MDEKVFMNVFLWNFEF